MRAPAESEGLRGCSTLPGNASRKGWGHLEPPYEGKVGDDTVKPNAGTETPPERASHGIQVLGSKGNNKAAEEEPSMEKEQP